MLFFRIIMPVSAVKQHRMDEAKEFYRKAGHYEPAKERLERIG